MITIVKAEPQYLDDLAALFNAYRVFYEQDSDLAAAKQFLSERMAKNESTIFIALSEIIHVGSLRFTLYFLLYH